jgi:hypothetical protein
MSGNTISIPISDFIQEYKGSEYITINNNKIELTGII